jgi:hypothetical protein
MRLVVRSDLEISAGIWQTRRSTPSLRLCLRAKMNPQGTVPPQHDFTAGLAAEFDRMELFCVKRSERRY